MAEGRLSKEILDVDQLAQIAGGIGTSEEDIKGYLQMLANYKKLGWTKARVLAFVKPYVTDEQYAIVVAYLDENWDSI